MTLNRSILALLLVLAPLARAQTPDKPKPAAPGKYAPSAEALERRQRSLDQLKSEEVPLPADGATLPDSATARPRAPLEVAQRAIAVCLTAIKAEGAEPDTIEALVKRYKAKKFFTPAEWEFVDGYAPTNSERNRYLWRYEGLVVLMWALGYTDELPRPDRNCDVRQTVSFLSSRTTEQFIADARLRSLAEILDQADLTFRYEAAVEEARKHGAKAPTGLERAVLVERHAIFAWLIGQQ